MDILTIYLFGFFVTFFWYFVDWIIGDSLPVELESGMGRFLGSLIASFFIATIWFFTIWLKIFPDKEP